MNCTTNKPLTQAQSDFATEHYHLIDKFLRIKGYPSDDFFDVVVFGFLRAVRRYSEREDLRQKYEFQTIAFRCMRDDIYKHYEYQNRAKRQGNTCLYDEDTHVPYYEDSVLDSVIQRCDAEIAAARLSEILTPQQRRVAYMKGDGRYHKEIAAKGGLTLYRVGREVKAARETIRNQAFDRLDLIAA